MKWIEDAFEAESFRQALRSLLSQDNETLANLAEIELTGQNSDLPAIVNAGVPPEVAPEVATVIGFLKVNGSDSSPTEVVEELDRVAGFHQEFADIEIVEKSQSLEALVQSPGDIRQQFLTRRIQQAVFPQLQEIDLEIDMRVVVVSDELKVVPVIAMRAEFDEPAISANNAISFQATPDAMLRLRDGIDELLEILKRTEETFLEWKL